MNSEGRRGKNRGVGGRVDAVRGKKIKGWEDE